MHLQSGIVIDERYKIINYISSGGFGNTYEAIDLRLDARVAIKELFISTLCSRRINNCVKINNPNHFNTFNSHKLRFIREARRLHQFSHPNIVSVTDVFEANDTAYFVMEFLEGKTLREYPLPLPEKQVRKYLDQILSALEHVHNKGVLHLDIKPENIIIDSSYNAILIDFGASRLHSNNYGKNHGISTTSLAYTVGYAPLEQMSIESIKDLGTYSDFYALGATLYKLLSGNNPSLPNKILITPLEPIPGISAQLAKAIELSMKVLYTERLFSVDQFRRVLNGETVDIIAERKEHNIEQQYNCLEEQPEFPQESIELPSKTITHISGQTKCHDITPNKNDNALNNSPRNRSKVNKIVAFAITAIIIAVIGINSYHWLQNKYSSTEKSNDPHIKKGESTISIKYQHHKAKENNTNNTPSFSSSNNHSHNTSNREEIQRHTPQKESVEENDYIEKNSTDNSTDKISQRNNAPQNSQERNSSKKQTSEKTKRNVSDNYENTNPTFTTTESSKIPIAQPINKKEPEIPIAKPIHKE